MIEQRQRPPDRRATPQAMVRGRHNRRRAVWPDRRQPALLAALDALEENWRQRERQYRNLRPFDEATADTLRGCAAELAATLTQHREGR